MKNDEAHYDGRHIVIHTDGACIGNPGPGGWAVILQSMDGTTQLKKKAISGGDRDTTNNKMEMTAAIEALRALGATSHPVVIRSDSEYVIKGMTKWLAGWKEKGWRTSQRKPVLNQERWEALDELAAARDVTWQWVRGHNGDPLNEEVDQLANAAARKFT